MNATAGQVNNAAVFAVASSQQLVAGYAEDLDADDTDWEWNGWVYLAAKATTQTILSKFIGAAGGIEFKRDYITGTDVFRWSVYDGENALLNILETGLAQFQ